MGSTSDEEGESSSHTSSTDERPLKKARYIWQIKGKYHLKTTGEDEKVRLEVNASENSVANDEYLATDNVVDVPCANDEQKDNVLPTPSNVLAPSPTTISDSDCKALHRSHEMYRLSNIISNLELSKWQDRQVARSFVDNTINGVLEVMGFTPLPFEAEDISDDDMLLPESSGNDEVEDEAVLMAIHSHGLQRSEGGNSRRQSCCNNNESVLPQCSCRQSTSIQNNEHNVQLPDPFHRRPIMFSPIEADHSSEENSSRLSLASKESIGTSSAKSISVANVNYSSSIEVDDKSSDSDCVQISLEKTDTIPAGSASSKSVPLNNNAETHMPSSFDQNDFLDQAVAAAILKKGLGTFSGAELG